MSGPFCYSRSHVVCCKCTATWSVYYKLVFQQTNRTNTLCTNVQCPVQQQPFFITHCTRGGKPHTHITSTFLAMNFDSTYCSSNVIWPYAYFVVRYFAISSGSGFSFWSSCKLRYSREEFEMTISIHTVWAWYLCLLSIFNSWSTRSDGYSTWSVCSESIGVSLCVQSPYAAKCICITKWTYWLALR